MFGKYLYDLFIDPFLNPANGLVLREILNLITLTFKEATEEEQYIVNLKRKNLPFLKVTTIILIIANLIFALNTYIMCEYHYYCWIQTGFGLWKLCQLMMMKPFLERKSMIQCLCDIVSYLNCVIYTLTIAFFLTHVVEMAETELNMLNLEVVISTNIQLGIIVLIYLLSTSSWIFQTICLITYSIVFILTTIGFECLKRSWMLYFICLASGLIFRMKELYTRLDFHNLYQEHQNSKDCKQLFDQVMTSSILIVTIDDKEALLVTKKDTPINHTDLEQINPFQIQKDSGTNNCIQLRYKNLFADQQLQDKNISQELEKILIHNQENKEEQSQQSLYDIMVQINLPEFQELGKKYSLKRQIGHYICYSEQEQLIDQQTLSKRKYYEVVLFQCVWENQTGILLTISDISEKFLIQQMKEMDQYKDQLLATVSHDLKTPLNGMYTSVQIVQKILRGKKHLIQEEIEEISKYIDGFYQSSLFLIHMINDLLDYQQINKGVLRLSNSYFSLDNLMTFIKDLFYRQLQLKTIDLIIETKNNIWLYSDETRVKQVLINLVSNASKFTTKGYIKIQVLLQKQQIGGSLKNILMFQIEDTGVGMPQNILKQIFKPYATYNFNNQNDRGIGLGLAISKKLVRMLGPLDEIFVDSQQNIGSCFKFSIYQHIEDDIIIDESSILLERSLNSTQPLQKMQLRGNVPTSNNLPLTKQTKNYKVLIVDDTPFNVLALKALLMKSALHCTTESAFDGLQAVEMVQQFEFDIILMDFNMPQMDGLQATRLIKKLQTDNIITQLKIIIITASNSSEDRKSAFQAGADGYLEKPINLKNLEAMLCGMKL